MRQGSNSGRRPRGRTNRKQHGGGGGGGQSRTHTFDSNGPDGRVRGNARQVYEKYLTLGRDATSAGDRIAAEAYFQHAEHYFRILNDSTDPQPAGRRQEERPAQTQQGNGAEAAEGESAAVSGNLAADDSAKADDGASGGNEPAADVSQPGAEQPRVDAAPEAAASGQEGSAEAPQKPRRGRPRKPRAGGDDSQARKKEASPESESDSAVP